MIVARLSREEFEEYHLLLNHKIGFEAIAYALLASNSEIYKAYLDRTEHNFIFYNPLANKFSKLSKQKLGHILQMVISSDIPFEDITKFNRAIFMSLK